MLGCPLGHHELCGLRQLLFGRSVFDCLADTPHLAVEAARASGCPVDRIVGTLSEETVERLGIQPGQPMRLCVFKFWRTRLIA
jgi:hypothetical protein